MIADNLKMKTPWGHCGSAARDFGCGQDWKAGAPSPRAVAAEATPAATKRLGLLIGLAVAAASFCPRSEAQTNKLTPGTVISWGKQVIPYVQPGIRYQAIAAGGYHSLALKSDGTVLAWGYDSFGESTVPPNLTGVIAIAGGDVHSLALKSDGTVVAWGDNELGQSTAPANLTSV